MQLTGVSNGRGAAEQAEKLGADLPDVIAEALRTVRGLESYRVDVTTGLETATRAYIQAVTNAASEGQPLPDATPLAEARAATLAAETAAEAVRQADYAASHRLEQVVRAHADALVRSVQPHHDRAVKQLQKAAEKIPGTIQDAESALMGGHGDAWKSAREALDAMAAAQDVRRSLRGIVRVEADPGDVYAEIRNAEDYNTGTWPQERVARCLSLVRSGAKWWCPTPAEHQAHVQQVVANRQAKRQAETVDPRRKVEAEIAAQAGEYFASELAARKAKPAA